MALTLPWFSLFFFFGQAAVDAISNKSEDFGNGTVNPLFKATEITSHRNSSSLWFKHAAGSIKLNVNIGDKVNLNCDSEGEPPPLIIWKKFGKPLEDVCYRTTESLKHSNAWVLKLENVLLADAGNYSCLVSNGKMTLMRQFILSVTEKKETWKPIIKSFIPQNLTTVVGKRVLLQCTAQSQFNDTPPYIKFMMFKQILISKNDTYNNKTTNSAEKIKQIINNLKSGQQYEIMEDGNKINIIATKKLERTFSSELVMNHVELDDDAVYTCMAFNEIGYSKETIHLHVLPEPKPTIYDLALAYAAKYGGKDSTPQLPLPVTVGLPVAVVVVLTIGFVWWKENVKRKLEQEKISLINIKKMRDLDKYSSLEHLEKFSSRLGTKPSSYVSEDVVSETAIDLHDALDDADIDDQEQDHLIRNGHPLIHTIEQQAKSAHPPTMEMIPLRDIETTVSSTPLTGRSSGMGSQPELEWEPVDLKLNIQAAKNSELPQILDTSA